MSLRKLLEQNPLHNNAAWILTESLQSSLIRLLLLQNMMVELVTFQKDCFSLYLGQISNLNFAPRLQNMKMYLSFSVVQIT